MCGIYRENEAEYITIMLLWVGGKKYRFPKKYYDKAIRIPFENTTIPVPYAYDSILKKKFNSSWVIFEAHTYSRVKEHLSSFAESLMDFDHVIVIDIYAAREKNIYGVSEEQIVNKLKEDNVDAIYISDYDEIVDYLRKHVKENDIILTLGAGNVTKIAKKLIEDK